MSVFAVVPVKTLQKSKTRLSIVLDPQERNILTLTMLEDVLRAITSSIECQTVLISSDPRVQGLANNFRVAYLPERKQGLNQAIKQATEWCIQNNAESVLVLPADIPLITPEDINQIVKLGSESSSLVISPSQNGGTNALLQKPPNLIPTCFGPHSFAKHLNEAIARGIMAKVYRSQRLTMDIDSPEDLEDFLKIENQTASRQFLEKSLMKERLMKILSS